MKRVPPKPQPDASNMLAEVMQAVKELAARQKEIQALVQEAQRISDTTKRARQEILADTNYLRSIAEQMLALPIGPQGIAGSPGRDGRDGKDAAPVNYDLLARMASDLIPPPRDGRDGRPGRDGVSPSVDEIVNALFASKRLTLDEIVDLRPHLDNLRRAVMRGGGDTVAAGSGVTITQNNGVKTISVSSSGLAFETPSGTINGVNTTFTVVHTPSYIVIDGVSYFENDGYTRIGLNLTVSVPPTGFIRSAYSS